MLSKTSLGVAVGAAAVGLLGYCVYFDHKRRSDPLFKQKLREKRKSTKKTSKSTGLSDLPDLTDTEAVQKFFLQEVQLGEELLATGDVESGVEHLTNAVAVCGQPQQLLGVLQQTLPPQVFQLLVQRLPAVSQKIARMATMASPGGPGGMMMMEDDLQDLE